VSNILKPKGYNVNLIKAIALLFENKLGVDGVEEVITKEEDAN
jgi:hypothetical protein